MANELLNAFNAEIARKAEARAPSGVRAAVDREGWTTRELARRLDVSERTARRYRQQDRIPARRLEAFRREVKGGAVNRQRERIAGRGLSACTVQGRYQVSKSVYETHPDAPVYAMDPIPGATMREVFEAEGRGDLEGANDLLESAVAEAYQVGQGMSWLRVDSITYRIR